MAASDEIEAMQHAWYVRPHVILMDICMRGVSGPQTQLVLQADVPAAHIPVVVPCANAMPADVSQSPQVGTVRDLMREIRANELLDTLELAFNRNAQPHIASRALRSEIQSSEVQQL